MLKIQTDQLLQKEMDRKAFLKNAGIAFAGLVGVTAVVKSLNVLGGSSSPIKQAGSAYGYGSMVYGGKVAK